MSYRQYRTPEAAVFAAVRSNPEEAFCDLDTRSTWVRDPVTRALGKVYPVANRWRVKGEWHTGYTWELGA